MRLDDTTTYHTAVSQMGTKNARFLLYYDPAANSGTGGWGFFMYDDPDSTTNTGDVAWGSKPVIGQWTHLAGVYDATAKTISLYINGTLVKTVGHSVVKNATGPVNVGRKLFDGSPSQVFKGQIADVQIFDRVLVGHDFTGHLATEPESGELDEPGILEPIKVGDWDFTTATSCYEASSDPAVCRALDFGPSGRRLSLTQGSFIGSGHRGNGLLVDGTHYIDDPADPYFGLSTQEYGRSQNNVGSQVDPVWQDGPVLRTDQSYTVSAWVRPEQFAPSVMTAVAQQGVEQSAFYLSMRKAVVNGVDEYKWGFAVKTQDDDALSTGSTVLALSDPLDEAALSTWTHLVGVYDAASGQARLYANGELKQSTAVPQVFQASGPLMVGAAWWSPVGGPPRVTDFWQGGIDDVNVFQGAMTDAAVKQLFDSQVVDPVEPGP